MGSYLERTRKIWEKAGKTEEGKRELLQYDQVVDVVVTSKGRLVERFQIGVEKGVLRFYDGALLREQPVEGMFVVEVGRGEFRRLFSRGETFIDLGYANKVRCLPTMKKDYLIGWVGRIFELGKRAD